MSFHILFALGSVCAGLLLALVKAGGDIGAALAVVPLGLGGLVCAIVAFQSIDAHNDSAAAATSPLGLVWLGMWLYAIGSQSLSIGVVLGLLFLGIWFLLIAWNCIEQLLGGPHRRTGAAVLGSFALVVMGVWLLNLPSADEKQVMARFSKEHCTKPGEFASLEKYQERLSLCPNCIGFYDVKSIRHERVGDKMVLCRVDSEVALQAACAAKGEKVVWSRNVIQTSILPWAAENFHRTCGKV